MAAKKKSAMDKRRQRLGRLAATTNPDAGQRKRPSMNSPLFGVRLRRYTLRPAGEARKTTA